MARWEKIHAVRDDVKKALEMARTEKVIGASLDAKVTIGASGEMLSFLRSVETLLPKVFIVSELELTEDTQNGFTGESGVAVTVQHAGGCKCERCWSFSDTVGQNPAHQTLCARCAEILA